MTWRIALSLVLSLCLAANASAQLASQTALVGTVTDSGGLVVPGAQVVAVNTGTKDTYEATTNSEGNYHIPFVRPGRYEITITISELSDVQGDRRRGRDQPGRAHERDAPGRWRHRIGERVGRGAGARHRPRHGLGNDRRTRDRRIAAERAQRLEPGQHDPRGPGRQQQRYRSQLPRRGPARNSEQPVARRHQCLLESPRRDQHAADRGRRDGGPGADRQHVRRVRRLPRRPHQCRDEERHQRPPWHGLRVLPGLGARRARILREHAASKESPRT